MTDLDTFPHAENLYTYQTDNFLSFEHTLSCEGGGAISLPVDFLLKMLVFPVSVIENKIFFQIQNKKKILGQVTNLTFWLSSILMA